MITRAGLADEIDGFDLQIKALNEAKSAAYKAYREQLEDTGMEPRRASAEVAATKAAIVKRRKLRENPDAAREKDDMIDAILAEIMRRPSRAREGYAGSSNGRTADFGSANAGSSPAPVAIGEITNPPDPLPPVVDGGQPYPSPDATGAKSSGDHPAVGREPERADIGRKSGQEPVSAAQDGNEPVSASGASATNSDDDFHPESITFLVKPKTAADYRPHCLHPEACGASGLDHCYSCKKALSLESEAA